VVRANSALLPTEYQLAFDQLSFGPGPREYDEPVEIDDHLVAVQLGPDFPREHPVLWWLTPIFHPNVFPNYDCEQARENPGARGLVCLGLLGESWQPSWDFGELCRMVVEMAAFRNYALVEDTGEVDRQGRPVLKGNAYDWMAARWIITNPERILDIGGEIKFSSPRRFRVEYPNVIEPVG
jgi:ubiquitin-protein ligase